MALWLVLSAVLAASSLEVQVAPIAGAPVSGSLEAISSDAVVVKTPEGERRFARQELRVVETGRAPVAADRIEVLLTDGSRFYASAFTLDNSQATFTLSEGTKAEVRIQHVRAILLKPLGEPDAPLRQQWSQILDQAGQSDVIVFRRTSDDEVNLDQIEGIIYGVGEETVSFEFDGDRIEPKRAKLDGLIFYRPTATQLPDAICRVFDISGAKFEAVDLKLEGEQLAITTRNRARFTLPLARLQKLDFSAGNLVYLSELPPTSVEWEPYVRSGVSDSLRKRNLPKSDEAFDGGPLLLNGQAYTKGLAIHSKTTLVYRFNDRYRRFQARVGLDDRVKSSRIPPHLRFVVMSEKGVLFEQEFDSDSPPIDLDLKIEDVQRLTLIVDYGEQGDIADHLNLCDARIVK